MNLASVLRRTILALALAGLLLPPLLDVRCQASEGGGVEVARRYENSARGTVNSLPFLVLRGDHFERGKAHGALGAREILRSIEGMASLVTGRGLNWEKLTGEAKRFALEPRYQKELNGMLSGIQEELSSPSDRAVPPLGREVAFDDLRILQTGDVFELIGCSQFSAWGELTEEGGLIIGRNFDYPPIFPRETRCLLAIEYFPNGRKF